MVARKIVDDKLNNPLHTTLRCFATYSLREMACSFGVGEQMEQIIVENQAE